MEDTIGAIQARVGEKYDQQRDSLASMHAENQKWLQTAVTKHMDDVNPQGPEIVVVASAPKTTKISQAAEKEAEKENTGKQRGEFQRPSTQGLTHELLVVAAMHPRAPN